jgi:15-cis-phytoene synthase
MAHTIANATAESLLEFNFEECRLYTRHHAKSFYFSSFLLPREKRAAAFAVYAFCRCADDLVDNAINAGSASIRSNIESLRAALDAVYDPSFLRDHPGSAFGETVHRYAIPKHYFDELITGVSMDLTTFRYETSAELDRYCYRVASVVGLIMTEVFGYTNRIALQYAADLGTAMQLTNILRDIRTDLDLSRIYLPQEDLRAFQYSEEDLRAPVIDDRFIALMQYEIGRARSLYASADRGIPYLIDDGSRTAVVAMSKIYSSILDQIEKHEYDVFSRRRYVSTAQKIILTGRYLLSPAERMRYASSPEALCGTSMNAACRVVGEDRCRIDTEAQITLLR